MDKSKSLHELEGVDEGDPKTKTTPMVRRCLTLHRTPLAQWSADDCRLMLGQGFSPQILVPLALEFLDENPLEECYTVAGALLSFVIRLPADFWMEEPELWWQVNAIVTDVEIIRESLEEMTPQIEDFKKLQAQ